MAAEQTNAALAGAMIEGSVPLADWLVIAPVAMPMLAGALLLMFRHHMRWQAAIAALTLFAMGAADAALLSRALSEGPVVMTMGRWLPPFGITFAADVLGSAFALSATFVALICVLFSAREIDAGDRRYGFYPFLMLMMAGISGAFLTGDIFNLYVWFEVFLISSFGLLILAADKEQVDGATKYAVLNLLATAFFLIATAYLYGAFGTLNMADIARKAKTVGATAPLATIAALYFLAFGMKAAAFPVNFWLPASYHTPRVVVAALFGGVLTKIGVYALLRTLVMLFPLERLQIAGAIGWIAGATMLLGGLGALAQTDFRRMVGFLVISGVGVMLAGLAVGGPTAIAGSALYAVHSMLAMAALYFLAGALREYGGSFSLRDLGGLYRDYPVLAALAFLLFLAAAGLPPGSGLWPKVMLAAAALETGSAWLAAAILVSGMLTSIALMRVFLLAFWRDAPSVERRMSKGMNVAALLCLLVPLLYLGVYPEPAIRIANAAASGLLDPSAYIAAVFAGGGGQ